KSVGAGAPFAQALNTRTYEPDAPNFTPRISGLCALRRGAPMAVLSVLKRSVFGDGCDRHYFRFDSFGRGFGHCVTTYLGDGNPLPAFRGEPYLLPLSGQPDQIAQTLWQALNAENRVSLAVKSIGLTHGRSSLVIVNQYKQVS
ncbi:MAG: inosine monophosphate cyclohydrolase, partial [Candidatus Sumerlaeota bacterium]|nr:inosine monophosphate cyclohydrolase [Candidatus Sumerlaeota bacterium]